MRKNGCTENCLRGIAWAGARGQGHGASLRKCYRPPESHPTLRAKLDGRGLVYHFMVIMVSGENCFCRSSSRCPSPERGWRPKHASCRSSSAKAIEASSNFGAKKAGGSTKTGKNQLSLSTPPLCRSWPAEAWRFREIEPRPRHLRSIPNDGEAFGQLKEYGGQPCVAVGDGLDGKEGPTALDGLDVKIPCWSRFVPW